MEAREKKIAKIKSYLCTHRQITGRDIIMKFDYYNYTDLISKLRKQNWDIDTVMVECGNGERYANYILRSLPEVQLTLF